KRLWAKGTSGNPAGLKTGSRHKATLFAESLLKGQSQGLIAKVVELGLGGDTAALKICMDRLLPPVRERPCTFKLPKLDGMARGQILPHESEALSNIVSSFVRTAELVDLETRLAALERARDEGHAATGSQYDA